MRTLKPIDQDAIFQAAADTGRLVVVEDHFASGGLSTIVAELLVGRGVSATFHSLTLGERWFAPGLLPDVLEHEQFTAAHIARRIATMLTTLPQRIHVSA